ncbi:MAG: hypothetical protein GEU99_15825 [Luteitalea sp.]|nr:hypothetical protein [Luteitalea sp.]
MFGCVSPVVRPHRSARCCARVERLVTGGLVICHRPGGVTWRYGVRRPNTVARVGTTALVITGAISLWSPALDAQVLYGGLVGTVRDSSGAAVPGATVTATNTNTGLVLETVSNESGDYSITNAQTGPYDVNVVLEGFKEFVRTSVPITVNTVRRVDVTLDVGGLEETVTVASEASLLQTEKADLHTDLKSTEIVNLPLNQYRNYQSLINLVPGAMPAQFQNAQVDTPGRALRTQVNGTNPNNNNTRLDGATSVNIWLPHHVGYVQPAETIDTVNISTNNFDAAQGMAMGAAVTVITKSGTNEVKGSAFYFRSQDELNARSFFDAEKLDGSISIMGGTVGGPIKQNKLFFFGSWEGNRERNSRFDRYTVPTERMRNGDFREGLLLQPDLQLFDPATGNPDGSGREEFPNLTIPADRISDLSKTIQELYPEPNRFVEDEGLTANAEVPRFPRADRDNYDVKINWNRSSSHQIWGKFSTMRAEVEDQFQINLDGGGLGDTKVYVGTFGHTWTLSPSLLLDGNVGFNRQDQTVIGADHAENWGTDVFGIPGTNGSDPRQGGIPLFDVGAFSSIGNPSGWLPLERYERSYTVTANLTKLAARHELRFGFDFVRHQLNHWQPEQGNGPRGGFGFSGNTTGTPGYDSVGYNGYAAFLLGLNSSFNKSLQFEEMSGRENQYAFYAQDRWQVSDKLTVNAGLRYEYYPLMTRENRGIERLDFDTFDVLLGGVGDVPTGLDINVSKTLFAPRVGLAYRLNEDTVFRSGYGMTYNPLPWSRPMRGFYPLVIPFSDAAESFQYFQLADGIPEIPLPDVSTGRVALPSGVTMRTPDPNNVERSRTQQWNVTLERRLPGNISAALSYVGTRTDGGYGYIDLNWADAGGGNAGRQFFEQVGTAGLQDWGSILESRYHALQLQIDRPFSNGLLLKGAYTWGKSMNMADDDGWQGVSWNQPSQFDRNYARAGFDRTHVFQMGFLYELPFGQDGSGAVSQLVKGWQASGIFSAFSGTPFGIGGDNTDLDQRGGAQTTMQVGEIVRVADEAGPDEVWLDPSAFEQPGNAWGNTGRNFLRGPSQWNLDFSLFRAFTVGRYRMELRAESANVLNHTRWGNPVTGFTDSNFMKIRSPGAPRRVQLGLRFAF